MDNIRNSQQTQQIPVEEFVPFPNHPFVVNTQDDAFKELVQSIRDNGLITEVIARPINGKYEIISGHRRIEACKEAGLSLIPAKIVNLDDHQATVLMVHSNIYRENIRHSEKAKAYRMIRDSLKHQGKKGKDTAEEIGGMKESRRTVYRYIKLSYLADELLDMIDNGQISFQAGTELGFLDKASQNELINFINEMHYYPTSGDAIELKKAYCLKNSSLAYEDILSTLSFIPCDEMKKEEIEFNRPVNTRVSFSRRDLEEYFDKPADNQYMEKVILCLLGKYKKGEIQITEDDINKLTGYTEGTKCNYVKPYIRKIGPYTFTGDEDLSLQLGMDKTYIVNQKKRYPQKTYRELIETAEKYKAESEKALSSLEQNEKQMSESGRKGNQMKKIIMWTNRFSGETGYVGDIDKKEKHFNSVSDKKDAKVYGNAGLATLALKQLIEYGEGDNNDFDVLDVG